MKSTPIYKRDSDGRLRSWQYEVEGPQYRTIAGLVHGSLTTSAWTTCSGKQGRNHEQQADFEANADEAGKLKREYRRTEKELDAVPTSPMLAHKYEDYLGKLQFPLYCQPKLDGIRCTLTRHGAFSREYQPHLNVDHILEHLAPVFKTYPLISFDGELYNHNLREDFGKIASVVRKQKPTDKQRAEARALIQYHVYDLGEPKHTFRQRVEAMARIPELHICKQIVVVVPTERVNDQDEFDKRSKSLLKRKEFITAEFKLLRVEEGIGNWAGMAKRVTFELPDGRECGAGVRGTMEEAVDLLRRPKSPRDVVTIRHFTPTPDGMPRFPVAIDFHFGGRKD
jgi:ATP-dependent DNA ligase